MPEKPTWPNRIKRKKDERGKEQGKKKRKEKKRGKKAKEKTKGCNCSAKPPSLPKHPLRIPRRKPIHTTILLMMPQASLPHQTTLTRGLIPSHGLLKMFRSQRGAPVVTRYDGTDGAGGGCLAVLAVLIVGGRRRRELGLGLGFCTGLHPFFLDAAGERDDVADVELSDELRGENGVLGDGLRHGSVDDLRTG